MIRKVLKEIVYGGHVTALEASAMTLSVMLVQGQPIHVRLLAISYLLTQAVYSYNHFRESDFDITGNPERSKLFKSHARSRKLAFAMERMAKWNEALRIEEGLGSRARFAGGAVLGRSRR